jgi:hypothetical protein
MFDLKKKNISKKKKILATDPISKSEVIWPYKGNVVTCTSCIFVEKSNAYHCCFDCGLFHIPDLAIRFTADVISRQGMLTPFRHLIPPLI